MSDFTDILDDFADWLTLTGDVYEKTTTQNAAGQTVEVNNLLQSGLTVNFWIDTSKETSQSDKFVNKEVGTILLDPQEVTFTPDTTQYFLVGAIVYLFQGVDNIAEFGEVYKITYTRDL